MEVRSKIMKTIGPKRTRLENAVARELWKRGLRFRRNTVDLMGRPDFAIKKYRVVIFIDSCFWHGCEKHGQLPKSNQDFWAKKIKGNLERDRKVSEYYMKNGWNILRVWEHQLKDEFDKTIDEVCRFITEAKLRWKIESVD